MYSYSVIFWNSNNIRIHIRSSKHYSLTSVAHIAHIITYCTCNIVHIAQVAYIAHILKTECFVLFGCFHKPQSIKRHWQLIWSKMGFYFSFGIMLNVGFFFFGALPIDTLKIKHTKKLKEIPSKHFLEKNFQKKQACMPLYVWKSLAIYRDSANI